MSETTIRSKSQTLSIILILIGGSLIIVGGVVSLIWSLPWMYGNNQMMYNNTMMGGMMNERMGLMMNNQFWYPMYGLSLAAIASGLIVIISGIMISRKPSNSQMWGIIALVFSIFGILGMGGFVIGTVFGTLGGILALFLKK